VAWGGQVVAISQADEKDNKVEDFQKPFRTCPCSQNPPGFNGLQAECLD
jgi:hypothetical protein